MQLPDSYIFFANSPVPRQLTKSDREKLEGLFAKTGNIRNLVKDELVLSGIVEQHKSYSSDAPCAMTEFK